MSDNIDAKVARIERLLKALDCADGKEDFVIHRAHALKYIRAELQRRMQNPELADADEWTKEELEMSLKSLNLGPPVFKRKTNLEIVEGLLAARGQAAAPEPKAN